MWQSSYAQIKSRLSDGYELYRLNFPAEGQGLYQWGL